jgi:hypothetical protein
MTKRAPFFVTLCVLMFGGSARSQTVPFYQLQITNDSYGHEWPSINDNGAVVWSEKDKNGYYQVQLQSTPLLGQKRQPKTKGNQNHERPTIDDNGDILYFQDNTGEGAGYEVILLSNSGVQSVVEFSSANPTTCKPPDDPTCVSWRTAGQNLGIASNGTTITYYDFCTNPGAVCVRRFDVSGIGELQCAGAACDFSGYDYPSINSSDIVTVSSTGSSPALYYFNASSPAFPLPSVGAGTTPHIADDSMKPQVVSVSGSGEIQSGYLFFSNSSYSPASVAPGVWSGVNNSGLIAYEQPDTSGNDQVWLASTANGIDMQCPPADWTTALTAYAPRYVVADAWGGKSQFPAETTLSGAQLADPTLHLGAYAIMNFYNPTFTNGADQIGQALAAIGPLSGSLDFLAVDLEPCGQTSNPKTNCILSEGKYIYNPAPLDASSRVTFILSAISAIQAAQLKPIIYTSSNLWQQVTGKPPNTSIGQCFNGGMCIKLWDANYDGGASRHGVPSLFFGYIPPKAWTGYAGWKPSDSPPNPRFGKQYNADCQIGTLNCTDDLLSLDDLSANDVPAAKAVCNNPEPLVDLDVFDPRIFQ